MTLTPLMKKFILHWGEMGTRWGVNRTVAQVHALLFLSSRPLDAEEIARTLSVARSNVSTCLRELQSWGIVRPVHILGDRREHFESLADVWEMARIILHERKRREIDPTLAVLRSSVAELKGTQSADPMMRRRLSEMLEFLECVSSCYQTFERTPTGALKKFFRAKDKTQKLLRFLGSR